MGFIDWLLGKIGTKKFDKIVLTLDAFEQIAEFAKESHPKEFSAFLSGKVRGSTLYLSHVLYQHFEATERSATIHINLPMTSDVRGTVHSHPSPNNLPSRADKAFFNKYALVNFIIA